MKKSLIPLTLWMLWSFVSYAQDFSNKGKDFWIGYGLHCRMLNASQGQPIDNQQMSLYITSDVNTSGTVDIPGIGSSVPFTVTANSVTTVPVNQGATLKTEGTHNKGIHVTSLAPVVVYAHIYNTSISGATLVLPTSVLGKDYYSLNFTQKSNEPNSNSYCFVIATEDNTTVEITPSARTVGNWNANQTYTVNLNKGQIYNILGAVTDNGRGPIYTTEDLTGTRIRSVSNGSGGCKRIAVFSGSGKIAINCPGDGGSESSSDNLIQEVFPTTTWGKKYFTSPTASMEHNTYRVAVSNPAAIVKLNGVPLTGLINNFYYEFQSSNANYIECDDPILVAQYMSTRNRCGNAPFGPNRTDKDNKSGDGDPEMIYLSPIEQTIDKITIISTDKFLINEHYVNVITKTNNVSSFKIDGSATVSSFTPFSYNPAYSYASIPVGKGFHTLVSDSGFNAIAYGYGSAESYGYNAGTNVKDLHQYMGINNPYAVVNFPAACKDAPFIFYNVFPYKPLSIQYKFNGLFADTTVNSPVYDSTWVVDNKTVYRYKLNRYYTVHTPGSYPISLIVNNPTSTDGCTGEQEIDYDLEVFDKPKANFNYNFSGCLKDTIKFMEVADPNNIRKIIYTNWNFGNVITGHTTSPSYTFANTGDSTVQYSYITDVGCLSDTMSKTISINPLPLANFTWPLTTCETKEISFSDKSSIANPATVQKWHWNFGDGSDSSFSPSPKHTYSTANTYNVSLFVESDKGCKSSILTKPLKVNYQPVAKFGVPKACINDSYASFTDSSSIGDHTEAQFVYNWKLDVPPSALFDPTAANPKNAYPSQGTYTTKLIVTSNKGCIDSVSKTFTINGAMIAARFSIDKNASLCSNKFITITNTSQVVFGDVVKLEIFWDAGNKTVDDNPYKGKTYSHKFDNFNTPSGTKDFPIHYIAYSGSAAACVKDWDTAITLKQSPELAYDSLPPVCEEIQPFKITAASEINNFPGTGVYTGDGITSTDGYFDPQKAKPGTNSILYTFTATNGCVADSARNIIVNPTPVVKVPAKLFSLEGGSAIIEAMAQGKNLSYEWLPNTAIQNNHILQAVISPSNDIVYTLTTTSPDGCKASADVSIKVLKYIKVPNAFSPNGDGIYDTWIITSLADYPGCIVEVYNRYRQQVYRSIGYDKPWNGTFNGYLLPVGTYYWIIKPVNGRPPMNGSVTIIR